MANNKQLIIVVEGTDAMAPYWTTIVSNYLDKIIRFCCTNDMTGQKSSSSAASGSTFELALVMFNAYASSAFLIQRSGWTIDVNQFFGWLSTLSFSGGESDFIATAEGLAEALMMFAIPQYGYQAQQNLDGRRHCILVSASSPCPLPTPVYRPAMKVLEKSEINEAQPENLLYDAETVSTWFGQCSVSLSVISPKQLSELKAIYNAANPNQRISEPDVDINLPHFLVLISDGFSEARAALSRSCLSKRNSSNLIGPPISTWNFAQGTVNMEPGMQSVGMNNSKSNMAIPKQGWQSKYVKIWEGSLSGKRRGRSEILITKLELYGNDEASETLAANWPPTMYINRFVSQDFMNKQYGSDADFLVFRAMNQHVVLSEMQEKKLCAVIQLPSQTLLLSVADKGFHSIHLIAKLFPGDKFVFKTQIPTQVTQQHQEHQSQLQQSQEQQQQQQQQPLQQQHHSQLQQYQFQQLQQHQLHSMRQQMIQYQLQHQPSMQLEQQQQISQPLQQHHHPPQLQQYQFQQLQQHQLHSMRQQMMQYQLRHQPSMQLEQQQEQQSQQQQQQPLQQHHHPPQLQQYQFQQLQQHLLYSMRQQMMQYQLRHQPSMQLEQQQQISQSQQIVDEGMGHDYMAEKEFIGKSKPL